MDFHIQILKAGGFMKKLVFTLTLMLSITAVFSSQLNIRMFNNAPVFIVLDRYQHSGLTGQHTFFNIHPGKHYLEVFAPTPFGKPGHLLFTGQFHIAPDIKLKAMIDRFHSFVVLETKYLKTKYKSNPNNLPDWEEDYYFDDNNSYNYRYERNYGMNSRDFDFLIASLQNTSFDNSRLTIAKSALRNNVVSSEQLLHIINTFTFESSKVEIAKTGWHSVSDKNRFFIIYAAFTFKSSINEIENYIQTH